MFASWEENIMNKHFCRVLFSCLIVPALTLCAQPQQSTEDVLFKEQLRAGGEALVAHKYKEAISAFKKANKRKNNKCADCYLGLATAYYKMGETAEVISNCDKVLALADSDATRAEAHNLKGSALMWIGDADHKKLALAETEFRDAAQLSKDIALFHFNLATALLRESKDDLGTQELKTCLALNPGEPLAERAKQLLVNPHRALENVSPEFQLTTLQGETISLKQLSGKIVVLDFWATWCPPCRESVPELKDLTKKYPREKLVLISVSADKDEKAWRDFIAKKNMDWPQFLDLDHQIMDSFSVRAFPTYLLIDGEGILRQRFNGRNPQESVVHRVKSALASISEL